MKVLNTILMPMLACVGALLAGCTSPTDLEDVDPGIFARVAPVEDIGTCSVPENEEELIADVVDLVNEARVEAGLEPLDLDESLVRIAGDYACEMIEDDFFAHENPETKENYSDRLISGGYIYYSMGENLAHGHESSKSVFRDWMESPGHRENILWPNWDEMGLAVRRGGSLGWYWVQEFADPVELGQDDS